MSATARPDHVDVAVAQLEREPLGSDIGIAKDRPHEGRHALPVGVERGERALGPPPRIADLAQRRVGRRRIALHAQHGRRTVQGAFVAEVAVQGDALDPGPLGDFAHRRRERSLLEAEGDRRFEDPRARFSGAPTSARCCRLGHGQR